MIFGPVPVAAAIGTILAHSLRLRRETFKKGRVLSEGDCTALADAGYETVVVARLGSDDIGEDAAADILATAAAGPNVSRSRSGTGRVNLSADTAGLAIIERQRVDAFNTVDEALTIATVAPLAPVTPRQMLATIKVIPFAAPAASVERCAAIAAASAPLVSVAPFRCLSIALVQTMLPGTTEKVLVKGVEATKARVAGLGCRFLGERRVAHEVPALAEAFLSACADGADIVLVLGASAITDRRDMVPLAVEAAGGSIAHFGMPVDPGNLTLLARIGESWVLGMPGSARSPRTHGSDWILQRLVAGVPTSGRDIMLMGAGGLLMEIPGRPLPRASAIPRPDRAPPPKIAALILAAGQSRRMGPRNKLLIEVGGIPMVRRVAEAALASKARPVIAVLGHEALEVRAALAGLDIATVENPDYAEGLSTSLKRGIRALPPDIDGAAICLGDMPNVSAPEIDRLIAAFDPAAGQALCVPTHGGRRGNPVLIARQFFADIQDIAGDIGARQLMARYPNMIREVPMAADGILTDVDTPEALDELLA
ncbi:MAG: NTP transferase domain-containing protein [Alphaproteobacteria bacterium]